MMEERSVEKVGLLAGICFVGECHMGNQVCNNIILGSIIEVMLVTAGCTFEKHLRVDGGLQV